MDSLIAGAAQVVTPANVITALIGGMLAGWFLVGLVAADPTWVSPVATPRSVGFLVGSYAIAVGGLFYLGQTVASFIDNDPGWARVASRFVIYALFCIALGAFTYARVRWHADQRHKQARIRARRELDAESRRP